MANAVLAIEKTTQRRVPTGKMIEIRVVLSNGETALIATTDYQWNHSCYCWSLSPEELAILIACKVLNLTLPNDLDNRRMVKYPDLNCEHVSFEVNGEHYDFSLYGMTPVQLKA